jgi:hypothetical protein
VLLFTLTAPALPVEQSPLVGVVEVVTPLAEPQAPTLATQAPPLAIWPLGQVYEQPLATGP